jgi:hypothetical protein
MPIPNTITRTLELAHPQDKVWAALTTIDGITGCSAATPRGSSPLATTCTCAGSSTTRTEPSRSR